MRMRTSFAVYDRDQKLGTGTGALS